MRKSFLLLCGLILFCIASKAQEPTAAEIRKLKIRKIKINTLEQGNDSPDSRETYYDANGLDTARYDNGKRSWYKKIQYDEKQRPSTITQFSDDGRQTEKTVYNYKPDGSYIVENTDTQFGLRNTDLFDKKGLQLSNTIPDGSVRKYVYNVKGQLVKLYAIPKNGGVKFTQLYFYNAAGKLVTTKNTGDYTFSTSYEYDGKGLIKKTISTLVNDSNEKKIITENYEYGY